MIFITVLNRFCSAQYSIQLGTPLKSNQVTLSFSAHHRLPQEHQIRLKTEVVPRQPHVRRRRVGLALQASIGSRDSNSRITTSPTPTMAAQPARKQSQRMKKGNRLRVAVITYVPTCKRFASVLAVIDWHSCRVLPYRRQARRTLTSALMWRAMPCTAKRARRPSTPTKGVRSPSATSPTRS